MAERHASILAWVASRHVLRTVLLRSPDEEVTGDEPGACAGGARGGAQVAVGRFIRDPRAGATSIAAAAITLMVVAGTALIGDQLWLVDQRDVLKGAANAAGVAATLEMNRALERDPNITDDELKPKLNEVARSYVILNLQHLSPERLARSLETLTVEANPDRNQRTVEVSASADLGGTLFSRHFAYLDSGYWDNWAIHVVTGVEAISNPVEVVLAIDISDSMESNLAGRPPRGGEDSRIEIVKRAATALVDILDPGDDNRVAVGLVPWHSLVRLDADARDEWKRNGWAQYPRSRRYGEPYYCPGAEGSCMSLEVDQDLPLSPPEEWLGCLDEHRVTGVGRHASLPEPAALSEPPEGMAFAHAFFRASYGFAYQCFARPFPPDYRFQYCHDGAPDPSLRGLLSAQEGCFGDQSAILPLTSDPALIGSAIDAVKPVAGRTYSGLGVLWAHRLLLHSWNGVWGDNQHPADPDADDGTRKAIVLLTDGEDSHCGFGNDSCANSPLGIDRHEACTVAKDAGIEVFVVAAMHPSKVSGALGSGLRACSSESDSPDQTYAFLDNATPEELEAAFTNIASQLITVRRVQ